MDPSQFLKAYKDPERLEPFLAAMQRRFQPLLPMLSTSQLSHLATAFVLRSDQTMYEAVCKELGRRIQASAPLLATYMDHQWTEAEKSYFDNEPVVYEDER